MVAPLKRHFFNIMYYPFLIKTYVAFPFYLSCFGLKEKRHLQQYQRDRSNRMDRIIISLKCRGLLRASSVRPEFSRSAWKSGKSVLILEHYSSAPNMISPAVIGFGICLNGFSEGELWKPKIP